MSEKLETKNHLIDSKLGIGLRVALGVAALYGLSHEVTKTVGFNPFEVGPAAITQTIAPEHVSPMDKAITTGEQQMTIYADQIRSGSPTVASNNEMPPISQSDAYQEAAGK